MAYRSHHKQAAVSRAAYVLKFALPFGRARTAGPVMTCGKDCYGNYLLGRRW